jgi:hypothetical protein
MQYLEDYPKSKVGLLISSIGAICLDIAKITLTAVYYTNILFLDFDVSTEFICGVLIWLIK